MKTSDLMFVGIKGSVVALNRATGQQVWATHLKGSSFVNLLVEPRQIFASTYGEIFCLDPLTGDALWQNPLKGFGTGLAAMATEESGRGEQTLLAEKYRQDVETAAAVAAASAGAAGAAG